MRDDGKPVILHVEDKEFWQVLLTDALGRLAEVIEARNLDEAEERYLANRNVIDIIVMDGCVPGNKLNTLPLVSRIRETFKGPMIASSGVPQSRQRLLEAGCDHECLKEHVSGVVFDLLGRMTR